MSFLDGSLSLQQYKLMSVSNGPAASSSWWVYALMGSHHPNQLPFSQPLWSFQTLANLLTIWTDGLVMCSCSGICHIHKYRFSNLHWAFWTFILLFVSPVAKSKWFVRKYELYSTTIINRRLEVFQERKFRTDSIANLKQKFKNVLNARSRLGKTSCLKQS